jgi:hypothetical protein
MAGAGAQQDGNDSQRGACRPLPGVNRPAPGPANPVSKEPAKPALACHTLLLKPSNR